MERACIASANFGLVEQRLLENLERMRTNWIEAQNPAARDISSPTRGKNAPSKQNCEKRPPESMLHDLLEDGTYDPRETFKTRLSKARRPKLERD